MYKILGTDGKEYGPVNLEVLQQWIAQGRIVAHTQIRVGEAPEWKKASEIPELAGLFAASAVSEAVPAATLSAPTGQQTGLAVTSMILGICSLVCFGLLAGIPAIITGHIALGRTRREPMQYGGKGFAIAGLVMGYVSVLITLAMVGLLLPALSRAKSKAQTINCVSNLKQIGLGARIYSNDNGDRFPKDFLSMSNELNTPKILVCPDDPSKTRATDWANFSSANVSYEFLTPGAKEADVARTPVFRCPIHKHICYGDGSVVRGDVKGAKPPEF